MPQLQSVPVVVLMVPLLFESGLDSLCSEIWVVDCGTEDEQLRRLLARDPISLQEARERLRSQWPMEAKRSRATVVIDNSGPLSGLMAQVDQALASPGAAVACVSADNPPAASPAAPGAPPAV